MTTLSTLRERALLEDRLLVSLANIYLALVTVLAATGLSGLLLFFVGSREKEIAIRIVLGGEPAEMKFLVVREAVLLTGMGLLVGLPLAYVAVRGISGLVYGVPPTLISPIGSALGIMSIVAVLCVFAPARRIGAINPNSALKDE